MNTKVTKHRLLRENDEDDHMRVVAPDMIGIPSSMLDGRVIVNRHRSCSHSVESQQSTQRSLIPRKDLKGAKRKQDQGSHYSGHSSTKKLQNSLGNSGHRALKD